MKNIKDHFDVLKDTGSKLWPYFKPSYKNLARTNAVAVAFVAPVLSNVVVNKFFLANNDTKTEDIPEEFDYIKNLASVLTISLFAGVEYGIQTFLAKSTMQAIKEENVGWLMDDESGFLMHGNNESISSLQYSTVGLGTRDFATNAIFLLVGLPTYTIASISTLVNIAVETDSDALIATMIFVGGSTTIIYGLEKLYYFYQMKNQKIENDLVGKVGFIEANGEAILLTGASRSEATLLVEALDKVTATIPKLSIINFLIATCGSGITSVASQFLGGYYHDDFVPNLDDHQARILNVMLTQLMFNM